MGEPRRSAARASGSRTRSQRPQVRRHAENGHGTVERRDFSIGNLPISELADKRVSIAGRSFDIKAVAAIVIAILLIFALSFVFGRTDPDPGMDDAVLEEGLVSEASMDIPEPDADKLIELIGEDLTDEMLEVAETDDRVRWVAANPDPYDVTGEENQAKLLKLATIEPDARDFVRNYPDRYPESDPEPSPEIEGDRPAPLLYQWDDRWGYTVYSGAAFAQTGCGPTSFAMVYQGLTGSNDLSPYDMGQLADENGFMSDSNGTDATFFSKCGWELGLSVFQMYMDGSAIESVLDSGGLVIANVGPGDFTDGGHFFVIVDMDEDGKLIINDPYSKVNSEKPWDVDVILGQTKKLYACNLR